MATVRPEDAAADAVGVAAVARRDAGAGGDAQRAHKIRLLVLTTLYPNAAQPRHGMFVEERLRKLVATGQIEARVVAPVPWFPFRHRCFGDYATFAKVPAREERHGIDIRHPRFPAIPKVGMSIAPALMARAVLPVVGQLMANGDDFDIIDAHYFYPDGVAAVRIGAVVNRPVVISARGTDLNVIPRYRWPRRQIQYAGRHAAAVVTVSSALQARAVAAGVSPERITVLRNGVDLDQFGLRNRDAIRTRLNLAGPVWLTVGHLIELKGVHIAIEALATVPDATLLIAGGGPDEPSLRALAGRLGVAGRVRFLGTVPHMDLPDYYNAADALIHASTHEGMPNVVLESLACGTPVVAAPFDGAIELLDAPEAGEIATARSAQAIASAWQRLRGRAPHRDATRRYARRFAWQPVIDAQCELYARIVRDVSESAAANPAPNRGDSE